MWNLSPKFLGVTIFRIFDLTTDRDIISVQFEGIVNTNERWQWNRTNFSEQNRIQSIIRPVQLSSNVYIIFELLITHTSTIPSRIYKMKRFQKNKVILYLVV